MTRTERLWRVLDRAAIVAMLVASAAVVWTIRFERPEVSPTVEAAEDTDVEGVVPVHIMSEAAGLGRREAPVTLIEVGDFQCPFCARHAREVLPELQRDYVQAGKVRFVYLHLPLENAHPFAHKAAEAAECAGVQGRFWEMHDTLFAHSGSPQTPQLLKYSKELGLDEKPFAECLEDMMASRVDAQAAFARSLGITGTPGFLIGETQGDGSVTLRKRINGALPSAVFRRVLDEVLADSPSR